MTMYTKTIKGLSFYAETTDTNYDFAGWPTALISIHAGRLSWWKEFRLLPLRPPCPHCEGKGGWTEVIDRELGGPHYDCGYCDTNGHVNWQQWLSYRWNTRFYESRLGQWYYYTYREWFERPYSDFRHELKELASSEAVFEYSEESCTWKDWS